MRKKAKYAWLILFFAGYLAGQASSVDLGIRVPAGLWQEVQDAYAWSVSYQDQVPNPGYDPSLPEDPVDNPRLIDNPVSKQELVRLILREGIKQRVRSYRVYLAQQNVVDPEIPE
jgi:hypothetical protein